MDYIRRKDALSDVMCVGISCQECPFLINPVNGGCKVENYIKSIPAADVIERKTGKWEIIDEVEPRRYGCSNCKRMVWHTENFCPNCGAEMEGNE